MHPKIAAQVIAITENDVVTSVCSVNSVNEKLEEEWFAINSKFKEKAMKNKHFPLIIEQDEDGVYIIECPLFRGCRSYGETLEQAMENIREAILVCIPEENDSEKATTFIGIRDIELAV